MVILSVNASVTTCPGCSLPLALSHLIIGMHYVLISADVKKRSAKSPAHSKRVTLYYVSFRIFGDHAHISYVIDSH